MKRKLAKIMAMLLAFAMILSLDAGMISAATAQEEAEYAAEAGEDTAKAAADDAEEAADDADQLFYRALTAEEEEAKEAAAADEVQVMESAEGDDYAAGEVIVFCDTEEEAERIAEGYEKSTGYDVKVDSFGSGVALLKMYGTPDGDTLMEYAGTDSLDPVEACVKLGADTSNNLPAVYPNYYRYACTVDTDNEDFSDPFLKTKESYGEPQEHFQYYHELINDKFVWKKYENDSDFKNSLSDVTVAVIDTGINFDHADFGDRVVSHVNFVQEEKWKVGNAEYKDSPNDYERDGGDTQGHGTNVAGIIGNITNNIGGRGVAAGVKIRSYRVLGRGGSGQDYWILQGLKAAVASDAKVINMSLGGATYSGAYEEPLEEARQKGTLVIAAAGNYDTYARFYPAAYDNVMSVAAVNSRCERSDFSNYGDWIDIAAPGGEVKDNIDYPGFVKTEFNWASGPDPDKLPNPELVGPIYTDEDNNPFIDMAGTSQATPVVSGCAALLFALDHSATADEVEEILEVTAAPLETDHPVGAGCVDIAEAMRIDVEVPSPVSDTPSGEVYTGDEVSFRIPDFEQKAYATIKYTTNGKIPCDPDTPSDEVFTLDNGDVIELSSDYGTGSYDICAQTLVYGVASEPAEYEYYFDDTLLGLSIEAPGEADYADVAEGRTIKLQAVLEPIYADAPDVTWETADPYIATVDDCGTVKGVNRGKTTVTAKAGDEEAEIVIYVTAPAEQIVLRVDNIPLEEGEIGFFDDEYVSIYPLDAATKLYDLETSDTDIVQTERAGAGYNLYPVSAGTATVTVTTADGTGLSETFTVTVKPEVASITSIEIFDADGYDALTSRKDLVIGVTYNGGSVPGSATDEDLMWEITEGDDYVELKDGILKATQNVEFPKTVILHAEAYGYASNDLEVTVYPLLTKDDLKVNPYLKINSYPCGMKIPMSEFFGVFNPDVFGKLKYSVASKDARVDEDTEAIYFAKPGSYTVTAEAVDGSGVKKTANIKSIAESEIWGMGCKAGSYPVVCPGGTTSLELITSGNAKAPSGIKYGVIQGNSFVTDDGYVKASGNNITGLKGKNLETVEPGTKDTIYCGQISWGKFYTWFAMPIELYPSAPEKVMLSFMGNEDASASAEPFTMIPGDEQVITASSIPLDKACQKYYSYKSGNAKVVTVDEKGVVTATGTGKTTVTVTAGDGSKKSSKITIEVVKPAESIQISSKTGSFSVAAGKTLNLVATVSPDDATDKKVTWSIREGGEEYASIDPKSGALKAKKPGSVTVEASVNGVAIPATVDIGIYAETKEIKFEDSDIPKKGLTLYTKEVGSCKTETEQFSVLSTSKTEGAKPSNFVDSSSDPDIAVAEIRGGTYGIPLKNNYVIKATGTKAGTAKIEFASADGTGKKASVKVTVLVPVTELSLSAKDGMTTLTPGKSLTMVATPNKDASNKKVTWSFSEDNTDTEEQLKNAGIDTEQFKKSGKLSMGRNSKYSGTFKVVATAADGSGTSAEFTVTAKQGSVSVVTITDGTKEVKETTLGEYGKPSDLDRTENDPFKLYRDFTISMDGTGDYQETAAVTSSDENIVKAVLKDDTTLRVYTCSPDDTDDRASKTGKATVTVKAADGSGKSAKITVNAAEPVRAVYISADKDTRVIAKNAKIKMKASVPADATNKKVSWKLVDPDTGKDIAKTDKIASISASGDLKPDNALAGKKKVRVVATPADGALEYIGGEWVPVTATEDITIYPAQDKIKFIQGESAVTGTVTAHTGETIPLKVDGADGSYRDYLVTYETGPVKVSYIKKGEDGTEIDIRCLKPGKSTITATARDGSGKKATLKVTVLQADN